ncbi:NitT/TauT family transport system ATP-binding protein [Hypnocyclicus thermotrophus]|uniref:NitT/TauT family transport system ATP-binding protein n=1 Tax=Hypnocyclicus thermotrophus TaxID=1627895 RepID=A0AA46DY31_9FUSO|nr:ATP-binding cassette domain-containing protein [Hypnocyclicus thermotrophus]TDT69708.1 NitT/TauT family transport system ATP-binding protein [Hypnocyclicus thermotrophus]
MNNSIKLISIDKKYNNEIIFKNFSIEFEENKIHIIFGPSGIGKTTLLNIIAQIEDFDKGKIINNHTVSYVFQEDRLLPWLNVYENIEFVLKSIINKKNREKIIKNNLKLVKLENHLYKFPNELSGGMQRRVALARAFSYPSSLLLMDEPFKGLDLKLKKEIISDFLNLYKSSNKTIILVTHDIKEAKLLNGIIYDISKLKKISTL